MKLKKPFRVLLAAVCLLVIGAILFGVGIAVFGDGQWVPFWSGYRYDDAGFEIGSGTVFSKDLTEIDVDWIDGKVLFVLSPDDAYVSLTEESDTELTEDSQLRHKLSGDGKTVTVKYRKSSFFLGSGSKNKEKTLIVRIPQSLVGQLTSIRVNAISTEVSLLNVGADALDVRTVSGKILVTDGGFDAVTLTTVSGEIDFASPVAPEKLDAESTSGDVMLRLPEDASFAVEYVTKSGKLSAPGFTLEESGGKRVANGGASAFTVRSVSGDLTLRN